MVRSSKHRGLRSSFCSRTREGGRDHVRLVRFAIGRRGLFKGKRQNLLTFTTHRSRDPGLSNDHELHQSAHRAARLPQQDPGADPGAGSGLRGSGWWLVPGGARAGTPKMTSLVGDPRAHVLRKKVMNEWVLGADGPPRLCRPWLFPPASPSFSAPD